MNINISQRDMDINKFLDLVTYNSKNIIIPKDDKLSIYFGIGMWSKTHQLSKGLPVDVMSMLIAATSMNLKIRKENPNKSPKVIVFLADSLAKREGAEQEELIRVTKIYKKNIEFLLNLLNMREHSEIMLASDLERTEEYQKSVKFIESSEVEDPLKNDADHYKYVKAETEVSHCLSEYHDVGIKVGWIYQKSIQQLNDPLSQPSKQIWDELIFDKFYQKSCQGSPLQFLYAKAGIKHQKSKKRIRVSEICPYTAYAGDFQYVLQRKNRVDINEICPLQQKVVEHWEGTAEVCSDLIKANVFKPDLLPASCLNHLPNVTVSNMLNHWSNVQVPVHQLDGGQRVASEAIVPQSAGNLVDTRPQSGAAKPAEILAPVSLHVDEEKEG